MTAWGDGGMVEGSGVPEVVVHFEARSRRSRFSGTVTVNGDAPRYCTLKTARGGSCAPQRVAGAYMQ